MLEVVDGRLRFGKGLPSVVWLDRPLGGDIRLRFIARQETGCNDVALAFAASRAIGFRSGYELKIGAYDNTCDMLVRQEQLLWRRDGSSLVPGQALTVEVELVGAQVTIRLDGEPVVSLTDDQPPRGDAGPCLVGTRSPRSSPSLPNDWPPHPWSTRWFSPRAIW
jgi:hypothetical protein